MLGFSILESALFHVIQSVVSFCYPQEFKVRRQLGIFGNYVLQKAMLDWHHAYIAGYNTHAVSSHRRQALVPHTDDAEVSGTLLHKI